MSNNPSETPLTRTGTPQYSPGIVQSGEVLSNLIHKIGHEIGNPLTAIISLATIVERFNDESIAKDLPGSLKKISSYSGSIIDEAWKISALNERLVMLLSQKPGNCSECEIADTLNRSVRKLRSRGRVRDLDIAISQIGDVPAKAYIDSEQFNILLQELLINAVTASPSGADPTGLDQPLKVLIKGGKDTSYLALTNDCAGAFAGELSSLFDPFVTS